MTYTKVYAIIAEIFRVSSILKSKILNLMIRAKSCEAIFGVVECETREFIKHK